MGNFNGSGVSGVSGTPNAGASYEVKKQEDQKMGAIPMTSGGGQSEQVDNKPQDFNVYGKDIANFDNFKGNDKDIAMQDTNAVATEVKSAFMELTHDIRKASIQDKVNYDMPDITFEPMPDPQKCGKKEAGFNNYRDQLQSWKKLAMAQIEYAREEFEAAKEASIVDKINSNTNDGIEELKEANIDTREAVIENANENKEEIIGNDNRNAAEINANVDQEGADTRKVGRDNRKIMRLDNERIIDTIKQDNQDGSSAEQPVTSEKPKYNPPSNNPEIGKGNKKEIGNAVEIGKLPQNEKETLKQKINNLAKEAGMSVGEYVALNAASTLVVGGLAVPVGLAAKLFE